MAKAWYMMVSAGQLMAAMDLPGYSHVVKTVATRLPGDNFSSTAHKVMFLNVNKGALAKAARTLPSFMQGFNVVEPVK